MTPDLLEGKKQATNGWLVLLKCQRHAHIDGVVNGDGAVLTTQHNLILPSVLGPALLQCQGQSYVKLT